MLVQAQNLQPGAVLESDVVLVGGGACGITLADRLSRAGASVLLLEGGGTAYDQSSQELYSGPAEGTCLEADAEYLSSTRLRYFGGTTNHWAGWCRPFDPIDFEQRDWVEGSGWPISHEEFSRSVPEAEKILETLSFGADDDPTYGDWELFRQSSLAARTVFHFSPPVRFRTKYGDSLIRSQRVRLVLNANVLRLRLNPAGDRVASLDVAAEPGREFSVHGRLVVLAAGGVENARLLLLSDDVQQSGVGNARDLVGRYFMDHPHRRVGTALLRILPTDMRAYRSPKDRTQRRMPTISLAEEYRRRRGLLGGTVQMVRRQSARHDEPLVRTIAGLDRLSGRNAEGSGRPLEATLNIRTEQSPNPASRVRLDDQLDRFGLRRARLDWQLREQDLTTITETIRVIAAEFARTGVGRIRSAIDPDDPWTGTVGGEHHVGTTRMAKSSSTGVVDSNCRVFGVENLYAAGSSVFPTAGYVNPTFSLVTLTVRLAEHLAQQLKKT